MRHLQTRSGTPALAPRWLLVLATVFAVTLLFGASAPAAPNRSSADGDIVNYPPPGSQLGIKGFDDKAYPGSTIKGYSQETKVPADGLL